MKSVSLTRQMLSNGISNIHHAPLRSKLSKVFFISAAPGQHPHEQSDDDGEDVHVRGPRRPGPHRRAAAAGR